MKPIYQYPDPRRAPKNAYFPSCCPFQTKSSPSKADPSFKKQKKFITLSKNISSTQRQPIQREAAPQTPTKQIKSAYTNQVSTAPVEHEFQEDKFSFLQQIRKYNPSSQQKQLEPEQPTFTLESSHNSSGKSNENNLSSILDSINNQMFSNLLVSSSIKEKIVVSASLRSISEVMQELEISQKSESYMNSLANTQR